MNFNNGFMPMLLRALSRVIMANLKPPSCASAILSFSGPPVAGLLSSSIILSGCYSVFMLASRHLVWDD